MVVERYSPRHAHRLTWSAARAGTDRVRRAARAASRPAPLSGAPKVRAMEIIDELEPHRRGPYGGAVGYFGYSGNMDLASPSARCSSRTATRHIQAGAGIVADSDPATEYEETGEQGAARSSARGASSRRGRALGGADDPHDRQLRLASPTTSSSTSASWAPRCGCAATTRSRSTRSRRCSPRNRDLARARARPTRRASRVELIRDARGHDADPRRLPGPPGDRPGVRRRGGARAAS